MTSPLLYSDTIEEVPADESADIARLLVTLEMLIRFHLEWSGQRQREVHVKSHGSAEGEFRVSADLPPELSQGLFAQARTYSARVRFSNSAPSPQPDIVPDGRGLAIQLTEVEGESLERGGLQDFVMVNNPTFLARNVKDYLTLQEERLRAGQSRLRQGVRLLGHLITPSQWSGLGAAIRTATQIPSHPAAYTYFSMVPFRFGQFVAKYRVRPINGGFGSLTVAVARFLSDGDAMRQLLTDSLSREELGFEFQVQLRTCESSMPIEDATVEWPEAESPYRTVATLHLPRQVVLSGEEASSEEHRSFDVWNGLVDHRPLGGINRARRLAYPASARFRRSG